MKQSAVQAFKAITSRIHPQLPLSTKESQRLLNALTSSFNHHLDQKLPSSNHDTCNSSAAHPVHRDATAPLSSPSSSAADTHLASILTSPLFSKPIHSQSPASAALSQLNAKAKHPVQVFEDSVASGQATIDIARLCLSAFRAFLDCLSETQKKSHLSTMAAGTRVLRWLWSSGKIHAYSFTEDRRFLDQMTLALLVEGNEAAIWDLIETTRDQTNSKDATPREMRRRKGLVLCSLVKAHLDADGSAPTATALAAFLRAFDAHQASSSPLLPYLSSAGALLSKHLIHTKEAAPASLYDRFLESCPLWDKNPSDRALYRIAGLKLHHPVTPSARVALFFIRHLKQSSAHPFLNPSTDSQRLRVFEFLFDTVNLLQAQSYRHDAAWVMEFMQKSFPHHFAEQDSSLSLSVPLKGTAQLYEELEHRHRLQTLTTWRLADMG
ncbi:hypothetical protein BDV97DRAFT_368018 [Delphinella strobiligena]|nr:hypothetical protein BDV97DRAFT_368018 [Delphinella strobiligena]